MPPRSSWKGFIRLSLVSVPVKAYTASQTSGEIRLNQLHKDCHNRIRYQKVCPEHGEVSSDEIVSGYEFSKGQYVVIDPDEVKKLRAQSDQSVHVKGFVPPDALDPLYHAGKTYYLVPDGPVGQKPYQLLIEGMREQDVHALAQVVLSGREQLVLLRPHKDMLLMTVLSHSSKVKSADAFDDEIENAEVSKEELQLTKTLIAASTIEDLDFSSYTDDYVEKLTQVIQSKVDGQELVEVRDQEEPKIINLMEALKKSVAAAQVAAGEEGATTKKKKAPSTRKASPAAARKKKSG